MDQISIPTSRSEPSASAEECYVCHGKNGEHADHCSRGLPASACPDCTVRPEWTLRQLLGSESGRQVLFLGWHPSEGLLFSGQTVGAHSEAGKIYHSFDWRYFHALDRRPDSVEVESLDAALERVRAGDSIINKAFTERDTLRAEVTKLTAERDEGLRAATALATSIYKTEYSTTAPNWSPLDYTAGVISQIDNMYAGIRAQRDAFRAEVLYLKEELLRVKIKFTVR